jgi:hypothetical protein
MRKRGPAQQHESVLRDELFLQPWFLPKPAYLALRRLLPSSQLLKMRYYFDDYGCLKCGNRASLYGTNGLCKGCRIVIRARVALCLARRFKKIGTRVDRAALRRFIRQLAGPEPEVLRVAGEESKVKGTDKLSSQEIERVVRAARAGKAKR